ncbi:hypothetical protein EO93_04790 [Methanosarcina sp. 1.H.A.2.2]|nr:hypothetical protein EO93_04790 [Methanosarcina sp. 1.H.A.2.2]
MIFFSLSFLKNSFFFNFFINFFSSFFFSFFFFTFLFFSSSSFDFSEKYTAFQDNFFENFSL